MEKLNLPELIEKYGSEDLCHAYLEELRWPDGIECPRCGSKKISRIRARRQFDCDGCRYQFSVRVGTLFHDSHLPLWKWFLAVFLVAESKKGISAKQLQRMLGTSYKTAWYLSHRIRAAMGDDPQPKLRGIIEADETWIGGKIRDRGGMMGAGNPYHPDGRRLWKQRRQLVLGAVERGGEVRLRVEPSKSRTQGTVGVFLTTHVADEAEAIFTDEAKAYDKIGDGDTRHESVNHQRDEWVRGDVHTQTIESVWSLFKRSIIGSYHHMSAKHLPAYLDEMEWRYNNRDNPFIFRDTMYRLIAGDALPYRELVDKTA